MTKDEWIMENRNRLWKHIDGSEPVIVSFGDADKEPFPFNTDYLLAWDGFSGWFESQMRTRLRIVDMDAMRKSYVKYYPDVSISPDTIDKLYLELSQVSRVKTAKEIQLEKLLSKKEDEIRRKTAEINILKCRHGLDRLIDNFASAIRDFESEWTGHKE